MVSKSLRLVFAIYIYEAQARFTQLALNLIAVSRIFIERVLMLVVFLNAVRDFINSQSADAERATSLVQAFGDIVAAISIALAVLGAIGLGNLALTKSRENMIEKIGGKGTPPSYFDNHKHYNVFSKLWVSVVLATIVMLTTGSGFALPFFYFALVSSFLIKGILSLGGKYDMWIGIFGNNLLELAILSVYFLSLCLFFFFNGAPSFGLGGLFILILVPRVSFGFMQQIITRE